MVLLNTRSLKAHFEDIKSDTRLAHAPIIGLCETWLTSSDLSDHFSLNDYVMYRRDGSTHGGVALYVNTTQLHSRLITIDTTLQCISIACRNEAISNTIVVLIYNPPSFSKKEFLAEFDRICVQLKGERVIIMGDFNQDISVANNVLLKTASKYNLYPVSMKKTVKSGKCLDVIFSSFLIDLHGFIDLYFTDHKACWSSLC